MTIELKLPHWEWKPCLQAVRHQSPTDSQNNIGYCHCPGFLPEIQSRILWLRVSCTSYTGLEGFDMVLNWNLPQSRFVVSCTAYKLQQCPGHQGIPNSAIYILLCSFSYLRLSHNYGDEVCLILSILLSVPAKSWNFKYTTRPLQGKCYGL